MTEQPDVPSVNELREFLTGRPVEPRPSEAIPDSPAALDCLATEHVWVRTIDRELPFCRRCGRPDLA